MSDEGQRAVADGPDDSAQFADLFGDQGAESDQHEGGQEQGQGQDDGRGGEGEEEPQGQARGDDGRFARSDERRGSQARQGGDDRAQRGLRAEVTGERGRRQAAEAAKTDLQSQFEAFRAQSEREKAEMRAQMDVLIRQVQGGQRQQVEQKPETPPKPDRYTDPDGYDRWIEERAFERAMAGVRQDATQRAEYSLQSAQQRDPQAFDAAYQALRSLDPASNARLRQQMLVVPDAGAFLMDWHRQAVARAEIGNDPNAYRDRVRAELSSDIPSLLRDPATRQAVLDHLRAEAERSGANGGPRTTYTPMPSLNGARGSNVTRGASPNDGSDEGIWDYAKG